MSLVSFKLTDASPTFPAGSQVGAYLRQAFPGPGPVGGQSPGIKPVQTQEVAQDGSVVFGSLEPETLYVAGALVSGFWRYMTFRTAAEPGGGGGGGGASEAFAENLTAGEREARELADATLAKAISEIHPSSGGVTLTEVDQRIASNKVQKTALVTLGSVNTVTPDLGQGDVFTVSPSGNLTIHPPINAPTPQAGRAIEALVMVTMPASAITVTIDAAIKQPTEPVTLEGATGAVNFFSLLSVDAGSTYRLVTAGALPTDVVRLPTPSGSDKAIKWNNTAKKYEAVAMWLTKGEAEAAAEAAAAAYIVAHTLSTGGAPVAVEGAPIGAGNVLYSSSSSTATWTQLSFRVLEVAMQRFSAAATIISATTAVVAKVAHLYRVTVANAKLTMPVESEIEQLNGGDPLMVEVAPGASVKVTGFFTVGEPAVESTLTLGPGTYLFLVNGTERIWQLRLTSFTLAEIESTITAVAPTVASTTPVEPTEAATPTLGTIGLARTRTIAIKGDGAKTVFKLKHELGKKDVQLSVIKNSAGVPRELLDVFSLIGAAGKVIASTINELEVTFETAPPATASGIYFFTIQG